MVFCVGSVSTLIRLITLFTQKSVINGKSIILICFPKSNSIILSVHNFLLNDDAADGAGQRDK